jgi:hypothetical protein
VNSDTGYGKVCERAVCHPVSEHVFQYDGSRWHAGEGGVLRDHWRADGETILNTNTGVGGPGIGVVIREYNQSLVGVLLYEQKTGWMDICALPLDNNDATSAYLHT